MPAAEYNFSIEQGSSFKLAFVYKDESGEPINISNWCARLTWRTNTNVTQEFSTNNTTDNTYKFTLDGENGKIVFLLPACVTNDYAFSSAKYDLELQSFQNLYDNGGGRYTIRILYGTISILKRQSKSGVCLECELPLVPLAPTNLTATPAEEAAVLSWDAPPSGINASSILSTNTVSILNSDTVTDYLIQMKDSNSATWSRYNDDVSATTFVNVTGLNSELTYIFRVAAINDSGVGSFSATSNIMQPLPASGA